MLRRRLLTGALAAAVLSSAGLAQVPSQAEVTRMRERGFAPAQEPVSGPLVSIEFKGGTLGDLVKAVRGATKEPVNISLQGDAGSIPVEAMSLREVSVGSLLSAALGARAGQPELRGDGSAQTTTLNTEPGAGGGAPIFVITRREGVPQGMGYPVNMRGHEPITDVLSIQKMVTGEGALPPEVVLTAIDTGLAMGEAGPRPQIKFHKDSGLLLVRGDQNQVALVGEIVRRMQKDYDTRGSDQVKRKQMQIGLTAELRQAEVELRHTETECNIQSEKFARAKASVDAGQAPAEALAGVRLDLSRSEAARDMARINIERLKAQADAGMPVDAGDNAPDPRDERIKALEARIGELEAELGKAKSPSAKSPAR